MHGNRMLAADLEPLQPAQRKNDPQAITVALNGVTVAELSLGGWVIDWDQVNRNGCNLATPRDCWIAQLLQRAFQEGHAVGMLHGAQQARDACPGCAHEPAPQTEHRVLTPLRVVDPRQAQQAEQQKRALADYLPSDVEPADGKAQPCPKAAAIARAIFAPQLLDIGLGRKA